MNPPVPVPLEHPSEHPASSNRHTLRSQRTRELIIDTMYRLALEKDYREITVQDLLARSGLSRSTFYAHFRDKEDLLVAGYESIGAPFTSQCEGQPVLEVSNWLFTTTERHAALTTSFFNSPSQGIILAHLENTLLVQVREHCRKRDVRQPSGLLEEAAIRCFVGALLGLWLWWVRHDYPCSSQQICEAFEASTNKDMWLATLMH